MVEVGGLELVQPGHENARRSVIRRFSLILFVASVWCSSPSRAQESPNDRVPPPRNLTIDAQFRDLKDLDRNILPSQPAGTQLPPDKSSEIVGEHEPAGSVAPLPFYWEAPEIWHNPLYFDDVLLERYGQTSSYRWQPYMSGAHFFLQFPILPYKMTVDRPFACKTNLGYYRPGSPTPCIGRRLPLQDDAALVEAATWVALVFILP